MGATRVGSVAELSIVLPTYNESQNISHVITALQQALEGVAWEAIIVDDDSPDGTTETARQLAQTEPRLRVLRRLGRRGLSGACIEGILASSAAFVAVMDADLQHDARLLKEMLDFMRTGKWDLVVASRYISGGGVGVGLNGKRVFASNIANGAARRLLGIKLTDPMSGFFMMKRTLFENLAPSLSKQGFKILLDIVASNKTPLRVKEVPLVFGRRKHGASKLETLVTLDYFGLLVSKFFNDMISMRFLLFSMVGGTGVLVHLLSLRVLLIGTSLPFSSAQLMATFVAMTSNFILNNRLTYRDRRLQGWKWLRGLMVFYGVCSIGVLANVGVAELIYASNPVWWLAGIAGAVMGALWNYSVSRMLTWKSG
nr:glycosyltransferase family 2 protein [Pseudovibrio sp. M1P-2-3]